MFAFLVPSGWVRPVFVSPTPRRSCAGHALPHSHRKSAGRVVPTGASKGWRLASRTQCRRHRNTHGNAAGQSNPPSACHRCTSLTTPARRSRPLGSRHPQTCHGEVAHVTIANPGRRSKHFSEARMAAAWGRATTSARRPGPGGRRAAGPALPKGFWPWSAAPMRPHRGLRYWARLMCGRSQLMGAKPTPQYRLRAAGAVHAVPHQGGSQTLAPVGSMRPHRLKFRGAADRVKPDDGGGSQSAVGCLGQHMQIAPIRPGGLHAGHTAWLDA